MSIFERFKLHVSKKRHYDHIDGPEVPTKRIANKNRDTSAFFDKTKVKPRMRSNVQAPFGTTEIPSKKKPCNRNRKFNSVEENDESPPRPVQSPKRFMSIAELQKHLLPKSKVTSKLFLDEATEALSVKLLRNDFLTDPRADVNQPKAKEPSELCVLKWDKNGKKATDRRHHRSRARIKTKEKICRKTLKETNVYKYEYPDLNFCCYVPLPRVDVAQWRGCPNTKRPSSLSDSKLKKFFADDSSKERNFLDKVAKEKEQSSKRNYDAVMPGSNRDPRLKRLKQDDGSLKLTEKMIEIFGELSDEETMETSGKQGWPTEEEVVETIPPERGVSCATISSDNTTVVVKPPEELMNFLDIYELKTDLDESQVDVKNSPPVAPKELSFALTTTIKVEEEERIEPLVAEEENCEEVKAEISIVSEHRWTPLIVQPLTFGSSTTYKTPTVPIAPEPTEERPPPQRPNIFIRRDLLPEIYLPAMYKRFCHQLLEILRIYIPLHRMYHDHCNQIVNYMSQHPVLQPDRDREIASTRYKMCHKQNYFGLHLYKCITFLPVTLPGFVLKDFISYLCQSLDKLDLRQSTFETVKYICSFVMPHQELYEKNAASKKFFKAISDFHQALYNKLYSNNSSVRTEHQGMTKQQLATLINQIALYQTIHRNQLILQDRMACQQSKSTALRSCRKLPNKKTASKPSACSNLTLTTPLCSTATNQQVCDTSPPVRKNPSLTEQNGATISKQTRVVVASNTLLTKSQTPSQATSRQIEPLSSLRQGQSATPAPQAEKIDGTSPQTKEKATPPETREPITISTLLNSNNGTSSRQHDKPQPDILTLLSEEIHRITGDTDKEKTTAGPRNTTPSDDLTTTTTSTCADQRNAKDTPPLEDSGATQKTPVKPKYPTYLMDKQRIFNMYKEAGIIFPTDSADENISTPRRFTDEDDAQSIDLNAMNVVPSSTPTFNEPLKSEEEDDSCYLDIELESESLDIKEDDVIDLTWLEDDDELTQEQEQNLNVFLQVKPEDVEDMSKIEQFTSYADSGIGSPTYQLYCLRVKGEDSTTRP